MPRFDQLKYYKEFLNKFGNNNNKIITGFRERQIAKVYNVLLHYYPWSLDQYNP